MGSAVEQPPVSAPPRPERGLNRRVGPGLVLLIVVGVVLLRVYVVHTTIVEGHSMEPTLREGDRLLSFTLGYPGRAPERGDVVVLSDPAHRGEEAVKRVIGLPGERLAFSGRRVAINDRLLSEPYVQQADYGRYGGRVFVVTIPGDHAFVMGDNRDGSEDSRDWGPVPISSLQGSATLVYWPWNHRKVLDNEGSGKRD